MKKYTKLWLYGILLLIHTFTTAQTSLDRKSYYKTLSSEDIVALDAQIAACKKSNDYKGHEAALVMRKAGVVSGIGQKYTLFKDGSKAMEAAIKAQPNNPELRFLRLMIQEQAPSLLGYSSNIEEDSKMVIKNFKDLPTETQYAVAGYSKKSKVLPAKDVKPE